MPKGVYIRTEEHRRKMIGRITSIETRKKQSEIAKARYASGYTQSYETRRKNSESNTGIKNHFFGHHHTNESLKKMSESRKGKKLSEEHCRNISLGNTGKIGYWKGKKKCPLSSETRKKIGLLKKGVPLSNEHRKKLSESLKRAYKEGRISTRKGRIFSEETKKKMRISAIQRFTFSNDSTKYYNTKPELKVQNMLRQLNIRFEPHKIINITHIYPCDIYIPSMDLIIECDGDFYHWNEKIFSHEQFAKLSEKVKQNIIKQKMVDEMRNKELQEKGYKVLRIWENDINQMNIEKFKECLNNQLKTNLEEEEKCLTLTQTNK